MIRKWMMTLLALVLTVMMPFAAMADTQHTFSVIPGDELAADQAIADLLDCLSLTFTQGKETGALTVNVAGEPVVSLAAGADVTGLYVQSNILSDDVLYVTWDDGFAVLGQLLSAQMDPSEAQAVQQAMEQSKQSIVAALQAGVQPSKAVTSAQGMEMAKEMFKDDPGMQKYVEQIYSGTTEETGTFAAEGRDTATGKYSVTIDNEDLLAVCDTDYMRTMVEQMVSAENPEMSQAELSKATDAMLDEIRQIYRDMEMNAVVTVYTVDEGMTVVGMEMDSPMKIKVAYTEDGVEKTEMVAVDVTMDYNRLTDANGVSHKANMLMNMDGQNMAEMVFNLYKGADEVSKGSLAMLVEGEEITITYNAANNGDARARRADLYLRSGATAIIEPSLSARPLIGFTVITEPADSTVLAQIENATSETAVNVMKLSEEQMNNLISDVSGRAMQVMYTAMGKLPASVLNMLMGSN